MMYECDTETIKDPDGSMRVWLLDACNIDSLEHTTFTNLDDFFDWAQLQPEPIFYFHNLKFDGPYLVYWLYYHGYQWTEQKKKVPGEYFFLITDMSQWFFGDVVMKNGVKITIRDSLKKIPLPVKKIAEAYKLPILKGEIDYKAYRAPGHKPTEEELSYIWNDTEIPARALSIHFAQGMTALTAPADAMVQYQKTIDFNNKFNPRWYASHPIEEAFCRKAYCGGICWVNPDIKGLEVKHGFVYDYNSMYPSVMIAYPYPVGYPVRWYDKIPAGYDLFIAHAYVKIERKAGKPACIRDPKTNTWIETYYEGELWLTSVDLELLLECYYESEGGYIILKDGYAWKGESGIFTDYINYWRHVKETSKGAMRQLAKLMLNSLYGKFGMNPKRRHKNIEFDADGDLHYTLSDPEDGKTFCVAVAAFVTAYARRELVRGILNTKGFCYCDTDSIHAATIDGVAPTFVGPVDDSKFLHWKRETKCFVRAKYLRQKTYIEELPDGRLNIAACGCPDAAKNYITYDNFKIGASYKGKLIPRMRKGGIELTEGRFTIREPISLSRF